MSEMIEYTVPNNNKNRNQAQTMKSQNHLSAQISMSENLVKLP